MQNQIMNSLKALSIAVAVVFVVLIAPVAAHAADLPDDNGGYYADTSYSTDSGSGYYADTSYSNSSSDNSGYYADTSYSTPSSNNNSGYYADTSYSTPSYTSGYYADTSYSYTTPTYVTYNYPTCTGSCGGNNYVPPASPTCSIYANYTNITAGQSVNVGWSSTHSTYGNISNLGNNLPTSGSHSVVVNQTTTFNGTFYGSNGQTTNCSATVYVQQPVAPTCSITGPSSATVGQNITLNWSSTNANYGNIDNLGTNLPANGSHNFVINNTTTFNGTFYGNNGQTTNCSQTVTVTPPVVNYPSCTITINNYGNTNNNYFAPNSAVTISWNALNASYGSLNQGMGSVALSGSRTIYPTQTTTYTGTFWGYNGQQVTCSATVYVNGYVPPQNPNTPFVTLTQVPYTGLDLGPVGTVLYWGFLAFWCALAAYLIVIKKVQNSVYNSLKGILFDSGAASHTAAAHSAHSPAASYAAPIAHEDKTDDFVTSQLNRIRA